MLQQPNETPKAYRLRLYKNKDIYGLSVKEIGELCNRAFGVDWDESTHRKKVKNYLEGYNDARNDYNSESSSIESLIEENKTLAREAQRERMKLQTEKIEYNRWQRELARDELFEEKVITSIKENLNSQTPPKHLDIPYRAKSAVLCMADMHFGKEFREYGVYGEILNEYSPEIFYNRMDILFNETVSYCEQHAIGKLKVFNLGDSLEGFLRFSQLWNLRYGVVDSAILFGEYMGKWLRELSNHVYVEYYQTAGNHGELRLLDGRKGEHPNENIEKVTGKLISIINADNPNFIMYENKTGFIFTEVEGFNVLGVHGEIKHLPDALKDYEEVYDTKISYLIAGHKHRGEFLNCGVRKGVIGIGSVVGLDDFSIKLRRSADPTATLLLFEKDKGKVDEHTFVLN